MNFKIGAQTIIWGENIKENMESILKFLSGAGYKGVETGIRHFYIEKPKYYKELYKKYNIEPVAIHSGGTFRDKSQFEAEIKNVEKAIEFSKNAGFKFFVMSGNSKTVESMKVSCSAYNKIGGLCKDAGLIFAYHNHNWEIINNAEVLATLVENTDPNLVFLVPDVGWITRGGGDPVEIIKKYRNRVAYAHLKDFKNNKVCELGEGIVNLTVVLEVLKEISIEWIIIEQDNTIRTPEESMKINLDYLNQMSET